MTTCRLALVADEQRLAGQIQAQFRKIFAQDLGLRSMDEIRSRLSRNQSAFLILVASSTVESERVLRLVQEICLQRLPVVMLLLEANLPGPGRGLSQLDPYLAARLGWPEQAEKLFTLLEARLGKHLSLFDNPTSGVEDCIAHRLHLQTPSLISLADRIALAATHQVTVLLTGETGTGKTHIARLLHEYSPWSHLPFLSVPCGAIPGNLVESAFFGHVKGAFTGATDRKIGKFEAAGEGTILLDEIDTLPLEQQAALLRVIETGEFEPVGSNETKYCQARIIVASNWDLEEAVRQNRFRQDLYYRLNVMSFHLPPLRERIQDIAPLSRALAARYNTRFKKELFDISPRVMLHLEAYPWPGNIRQLENVIQQAVLVSTGTELLVDHLPQQIRDQQQPLLGPLPVPTSPDSLKYNRETTERNVILKALSSNDYNRSKTAASLGISRVTLYKKMRDYGLLDTTSRKRS